MDKAVNWIEKARTNLLERMQLGKDLVILIWNILITGKRIIIGKRYISVLLKTQKHY